MNISYIPQAGSFVWLHCYSGCKYKFLSRQSSNYGRCPKCNRFVVFGFWFQNIKKIKVLCA